MVDPISLAVISGTSFASMVFGRFSKKTQPVEETSYEIGNKLHFINVGDSVNPNLFVKQVKDGDTFFLNIRELINHPEDLSDFLYNLEIIAKRNQLTLKQISSELLILAHQDQKMMVGTVAAKAANREDPKKAKISVMGS